MRYDYVSHENLMLMCLQPLSVDKSYILQPSDSVENYNILTLLIQFSSFHCCFLISLVLSLF